jgi:hypothetical protein
MQACEVRRIDVLLALDPGTPVRIDIAPAALATLG